MEQLTDVSAAGWFNESFGIKNMLCYHSKTLFLLRHIYFLFAQFSQYCEALDHILAF